MEEGGFGDRFDVGFEGEGGVKNDTQVADLGGWEDGAAVNVEEEISNLLERSLWGHNHELCLCSVLGVLMTSRF